jgi:hypothetical protein
MRRLTKQEEELTQKGLSNKQKEVAYLRESLRVQEANYLLHKQKCRWEDDTREFMRDQQETSYKDNIQLIKEKIDMAEFSIKTMKDQLKNGVKEKEVNNGNSEKSD